MTNSVFNYIEDVNSTDTFAIADNNLLVGAAYSSYDFDGLPVVWVVVKKVETIGNKARYKIVQPDSTKPFKVIKKEK